MGLGRRETTQPGMWVATHELPRSPGHVFYEKLNRLLAEADFDRQCEELCAPYYADAVGRPSIPPGVYCRMLFVGYFEGLDSQRAIAWKCADSLSVRTFLGLEATAAAPDHSSLTRIRQRLPWEVHLRVFTLLLEMARTKGLLRGKTLAIDATTLEANAAMKTMVRRVTRRGLEGVPAPADEGRGNRRSERRRAAPLRPQAHGQEGVEHRVDVADRSGQPDHEDEGWAHALRLQGRARDRRGERPDRGRADLSGRHGGRGRRF